MKGIKEALQIEIFKTAFESSYDGIHILDRNGNTLYMNKACTRIEGISIDEAMSKNITELVKDGIYSESVTLKVLEKKKSMTIVQTAQNGKQILATGTPIYKNGEIDMIVVNSRDVTELNELKQELSKTDELARKYHKELELLRLEQFNEGNIIAKSLHMQKIIRQASIVANVDSNILITGESGVGKGALAQYIHNSGHRKAGPFIKIDCSAVPESLFESELFGYVKGAFTGAEKEGKIGLFELADGGTVFLDEIGEIPFSMQAKLLRAIQEHSFIRVGGNEVININVRIIAATNVDLKTRVEEKKFREDLYYRLNVVPIHIPPLRERKEDILPLILQFADDINEKYKWEKRFSKKAIDNLIAYSWPGNVRELENVVERLFVSSEKKNVDAANFANDSPRYEKNTECIPEEYKQTLERFDYQLLQMVIEEAGSVKKAAELIGLDVTTVRRKLKKYERILL